MELKRGSDRYIGGKALMALFICVMLAIAGYGLYTLSTVCQGQCIKGNKACQVRCFDRGVCPMQEKE
jgi:hypothetical protein